MLDVFNRYFQSYITLPVVLVLYKEGPLSIKYLSQHLNTTPEHIKAVLDIGESLQWITPLEDNLYKLTLPANSTDILSHIYEEMNDLYKVPISDILSETNLNEHFKKSIEYIIQHQPSADFLEGSVIMPILVALRIRNKTSVPKLISNFFIEKGWANKQGENIVFTSLGRFLINITAAYFKQKGEDHSLNLWQTLRARFENMPYIIQHTVYDDVSALAELERLCWPDPLHLTKKIINSRIDQNPQAQFIIKINNHIVGALYTIRIMNTDELRHTSFKNIATLYNPEGNIIQLLGISVHPDMQGRGLGDQLAEFILLYGASTDGIDKVVGVTRCKEYVTHAPITMEEYIKKHNEQTGGIDPILRFHTARGAKITAIIENYRPEDKDNNGAGILVEYEIKHLGAKRPVTHAASQPKQELTKETTSVEQRVTKHILSILSEEERSNYSATTPLRDQGFDSLKILELRTLLRQEFSTEIDSTFLFSYGTPVAIINYFSSHINENIKEAKKTDSSMSEVDESIAIIGIGCRFPGGIKNDEDFWQLLKNGKDAITPVPENRWASDLPYPIHFGGFLDNIDRFDSGFFNIYPREAELIDPQQRILLEVTWEALENAGICADKLIGTNTGVFLGIFANDYEILLSKNQKLKDVDAYYGTGNSISVAAGRVSYALGLQGPSMAINTACSSSLVAVHLACQSLNQKESDIALAAGVNVILSPDLSVSFAKAGMLAPDGRCKTFDALANGYVRSEGCGVLVLKRLTDAIRDNDNIYAVIRGTAVNQDGASNGLTAPNEMSQEVLLNNALKNSKISPESVSYIEAHGTGTILGDPIEVKAIGAIYGKNRTQDNPLYLGSVKTNFGHTESAAGVAGMIKVILALQHQQIPAHLHFSKLNPHIDFGQIPIVIPTKMVPWQTWQESSRRAGVSSFGFSGTNSHVILEQSPKKTQSQKPVKPAYLITLSAKSEKALKQKIEDLATWFEKRRQENDLLNYSIEDISYTLNAGRRHFDSRCIFVASSREELQTLIETVRQGKQTPYYLQNLKCKPSLSGATNEKVLIHLNDIAHYQELDADNYRNTLMALGELYINGAAIEWQHLHHNETNNRIPLPTYPFAKNRYWMPETEKPKEETTPLSEIAAPKIEAAPIVESVAAQQATTPVMTKTTDLLLEQIQNHIINTMSEILKIKTNDMSSEDSTMTLSALDELSNFGIDSISLTAITNKLNEYYGLKLMPTIWFEHTTIRSFAEYLIECHRKNMEARHGGSTQAEISKPLETPIAKTSEPPISVAPTIPVANKTTNQNQLLEKVQNQIISTMSEVLKINASMSSEDNTMTLSALDELSNFGIDSISLTAITNKLNEYYGLKLMPTIWFEHTTIKSFAEYLIECHNKVINARHIVTEAQNVQSVAVETPRETPQQVLTTTQNVSLKEKPETTPTPTPTLTPTPTPTPTHEDIAIIGISGRFPGSPDLDSLWENLKAQRNMISEIPKNRWDWETYYGDAENQTKVKWGGFVEGIDEFDAAFFNISPLEAELMDPQQRILLQTVWKTIEDAGYTPEDLADIKAGLFVGVATADYAEILQKIHETSPHASTGIAHSVLANRISYLLNLNGPSEAIDTACSSSLIALHNAIYAIREGDCDVAIVGGVNALLTPTYHLEFTKAGMLSDDGSCKTFDKGANGYVRGEGVGAILIKPLSKAIADKDTIYGVIKGTAVNHGGHVNSLTAPNPLAQANLIVTACERAHINVDTISYIEAHGTGTALGDPIELNGLKKAFQTLQKNQNIPKALNPYCGVGSIKTNIGHLEAAAGIAGIIKVLLSMKYKTLPGVVNFKELNPYLEINDTPFYIVTKTAEWKRLQDESGNEVPRRAGISSFGFGGANAHVIIEESTIRKDQSQLNTKPAYLITLSAKSDYSLKQKITELEQWLLKLNPDEPSLEDISFTLNSGRIHFNHRCSIVVSSLSELLESVKQITQGNEPNNVFFSIESKKKRPEPIFEELLINILNEIKNYQSMDPSAYRKKLSALADLYVKGFNIDWALLHGNERQRRIPLPTYPFAKDKYWVSLNKETDVVTIPTAASYLHPFLDENVTKMGEYSFNKLFTGNEFYLTDHRINDIKTLPGVAYLEMARAGGALLTSEQYAIKLKNLIWVQPIQIGTRAESISIKYKQKDSGSLSFEVVSGTPNAGKGAVVHAQGDLYFDLQSNKREPGKVDLTRIKEQCINRVGSAYEYFNSIGFQYGPAFQAIQKWGTNLNEAFAQLKLPSMLEANAEQFVLHPSILDGALQTVLLLTQNNKIYLPSSIGSLEIFDSLPHTCYVYTVMNQGSASDRSLKFQIKIADETGSVVVQINDFIVRAMAVTEKENVYSYYPVWEKLSNNITSPISLKSPVLLLDDNDDLIRKLREMFPIDTIVLAKTGTTFHKIDEFNYFINENSAEDYLSLMVNLAAANLMPKQIIHRISSSRSIEMTHAAINDELQHSFYPFLYLSQALIKLKPKDDIHILYLNETKDEQDLFVGALSAFAKTLHFEQPKLICRLVNTSNVLTNIENLLGELKAHDWNVRYDAEQIRYVQRYKKVDNTEVANVTLPLKKGGTYLVTGGAGKLGLLFARYLAENYQCKLILVGRSPLNDKLKSTITELEALGSEVQYLPVDIAEHEELHRALTIAKGKFGSINGVIHTAGVLQDSYILKKTVNQAAQVFSPKVHGTINLDSVTQSEPLDFFVMFSSIASVYGNPGQCDYAYANAFMDLFSAFRQKLRNQNQRQGKTLSINWPLWIEGGMKVDEATELWEEESLGTLQLPTQDGIEAFKKALIQEHGQQVVLVGHKNRIEQALEEKASLVNFKLTNGTPVENAVINVSKESNSQDRIMLKTQEWLKHLISTVNKLPPDKIKSDEPFESYGIDSIMIVTLNRQLEKTFGDLPKTLFFEYFTVDELTNYFIENHSESLLKQFGADIQPDVIVEPEIKKPLPVNRELVESPQLKEHETTNKPELVGDDLVNPLDIAIIGLSGRYPQANDLETFWDNLKSGKNSITEIPQERWDKNLYFDADKNNPNKSYSKWGGFIDDVDKFDPFFFNISPHEAESMDPQERLFLETVWKTIEDAGYARKTLAGKQVGVYVGAMYGLYQLFGSEELQKSNVITASSVYASIANRVSYYFNFHGPSLALDTMCSSSLTTVHLACQSIRQGDCELAIAGGVNLSIHPFKYILLSQGKFLSSDGLCRSFGEGGDGYVPGEGVGAVLLKPLKQALADGDHIYGVIKGSNINHGGKTNGYTVPNPSAQAELIEKVYNTTKIDPATISYVEAHGTGTSLGDPIEMTALSKVFDRNKREELCPIGSVKSNIGHCESAAGIAAITKILLQLQHKSLVPSIHSETLNPNINWPNVPFKVQRQLGEWQRPVVVDAGMKKELPRRAAVSSFGAGGSNAHLIIEEAPLNNVESQNPAKPSCLLTLSAKTAEALRQQIKDLQHWLIKNIDSANKIVTLDDMSFTLNVGRSHFEYRFATVVNNLDELRATLQLVTSETSTPNAFIKLREKEQSQNQAIYNELYNQVIKEVTKPDQLTTDEYRAKLLTLANLYVEGAMIEWDKLYLGEKHKRISLPTYPFAKIKCWFEPSKTEPIIQKPIVSTLEKENINTVADNKVTTTKSNGIVKDKITRIVKNMASYGEDDFSVSATFEELGVGSMGGIELINLINDEFNLDMSATELFTYPTIIQLAKFVESKIHKTSPPSLDVSTSVATAPLVQSNDDVAEIEEISSMIIGKNDKVITSNANNLYKNKLVSINTQGDHEPIFWVPGAIAIIDWLILFSHNMGKTYPIYSFEFRGLKEGETPFTTVEEIAESFLIGVKKIKPKGPYNFAGFSFGGTVIHEAARQLKEKGETVSNFIMFDSYAPESKIIKSMINIHIVVPLILVNFFGSFWGSTKKISYLDFVNIKQEKRLEFMVDQLQRYAKPPMKGEVLYNFLAKHIAIATTNFQIVEQYHPTVYDEKTKIYLFQAAKGLTGAQGSLASELGLDAISIPTYDKLNGWEKLFKSKIKAFTLPCDHFEMVIEPYMTQITNILKKIKLP